MDDECWMKSFVESELRFDFFRSSGCFETWLLLWQPLEQGSDAPHGFHTVTCHLRFPVPPATAMSSTPHSMPLFLWRLSKVFPGKALPLAFVFPPPHFTGAWCRYWGMVFLETALIAPSPTFRQPGQTHGRSVRNEAAFICNLPPALSWVPFFTLGPSQAWRKIILPNLSALTRTTPRPPFSTTPYQSKGERIKREKKPFPQWKHN